MAERVLGIDLGTTHSVVAVCEEGVPRVLADAEGRTLFPSVVAEAADGVTLVGEAARQRAIGAPGQAAARFKPDMGSDHRRTLGGRRLSPTALSALVLRHVVDVATSALPGVEPLAVVSVPAWFGEPQRRATLDAAQLAGIDVLRLINEPTAAAIAHGLHADPEPRAVAVLDLGGGTFDVTLLEAFDGLVDVAASVGDVNLGGEDATDAVVALLCADAGMDVLDPALRGRLRLRAEAAKRRLSEAHEVAVERAELDGGTSTLDRARFEAACAPLIQRVRRLTRQALMQSGLRAGQLDEVVLVGGAARMPWLAAVAEELLGRPPLPLRELDHLVALGAAVQAALVLDHAAVRDRVVTDVLTHSLGVAVVQRWGEQAFDDRFDPVLPRGTTLPASRTGHYQPVDETQPTVELTVYEGEHRVASDNTLLGQLSVGDLPVGEGVDRSVAVRFAHDASGLLHVEATVSTGARASLVLERSGTTYDPDERAAALAELQRLSVPARELLPNRVLLERATWVVELLAGPVRAELDQLLVAFEAALAAEDAQRIARWRAALGARVDQVAAQNGLELP